MLPASNTIVGVDFGAPRRARDQRRKIRWSPMILFLAPVC
jgi:hypothetical protein